MIEQFGVAGAGETRPATVVVPPNPAMTAAAVVDIPLTDDLLPPSLATALAKKTRIGV